MRVQQAKAVAQRWVMEVGRYAPGFMGAFYHGSTNWLPDDALLPETSDLDVMVVCGESEAPIKPGKFLYQGVLLEVSHMPDTALQSPAQVLGQYQRAGSFRTPGIILDPSGQLTALQAAVSKEYARRPWVMRRCADARDKSLRYLQSPDASAPLHDQVTAWLFGTGITTHVLLVAGLRNPTVRRRYVAARELLTDYGHTDFYPTLLEMLGVARIDQRRAARHLDSLAELFDTARAVIATPFPFAADLSAQGRRVAIDGSRELIARGDHREAMFWIVATASRCQKVLLHDAPKALQEQHRSSYERLLNDLGITSFADLQRRSTVVQEVMPDVWAVAEAIVAVNREIEP